MRLCLVAFASVLSVAVGLPALADGMPADGKPRIVKVHRTKVVHRWEWGTCRCGGAPHPAIYRYGLPASLDELPHHKDVPAPIVRRAHVVRTVKTVRRPPRPIMTKG